MAHIALEAQDVQRAMTLWGEALSLAQETADAMGLFHVASAMGQVFAQAGQHEEARKLLSLAVQVGKQAGFPQVAKLEALVRKLAGKE
jgi:hypothetical protein